MSVTDNEKTPIEAAGSMGSSPKSAAEGLPIDPVAEKKLMRKLDLVIYPIFFVIYMMSFLDRINIGNAKIQGMVEELELTGNRYNVALFVSLTMPFDTIEDAVLCSDNGMCRSTSSRTSSSRCHPT